MEQLARMPCRHAATPHSFRKGHPRAALFSALGATVPMGSIDVARHFGVPDPTEMSHSTTFPKKFFEVQPPNKRCCHLLLNAEFPSRNLC